MSDQKAPNGHPLVDEKTGLISRPWLSWLQDLQDRSPSTARPPASGVVAKPPPANITVNVEGGVGTLTGTGTAGDFALWNGPDVLGDSIMSEVGSAVKVDGALVAQTLQGQLAPNNITGFPNDPNVFLDGLGQWTRPSANHVVGEVAGGAINGVNTTFTTKNPASELSVFLNGLELTRGQDWDVLSSTKFSIFIAPVPTAPTDIVTVSYAL